MLLSDALSSSNLFYLFTRRHPVRDEPDYQQDKIRGLRHDRLLKVWILENV